MAPPITKVQCRERWRGRGGCGLALLSCRHAGFFIPVSQLFPWTTDSMWHSSPGKKITIQTSMHCHIKLYFNLSLYNSLKSGPGAVPSLSSYMFVFIPWHWNMPQKDPSGSWKPECRVPVPVNQTELPHICLSERRALTHFPGCVLHHRAGWQQTGALL